MTDRATDGRQSLGDQIAGDLRERIANREWLPDAKLPSIRQLSRHYRVAPLTISRVVRHLADEGLVRAVQSKGIYVTPEPAATPDSAGSDANWQLGLLRRRWPRSSSVTLPHSLPDDTINLATGTMSNLAIPIDSLRRAILETGLTYGEGPVWQRSPQGEMPLRAWFAAQQAALGIGGGHASRLIVSSSHQAFRVIAGAIIEPGDVVLIESPSDPIVMGVFEQAGARCLAVEIDADGMNVDQAHDLAMRHRPKAIVTCSSGQIPTGVTISIERRKRLVQLGQESQSLIVEYDNGNEVWFDHPPPPPVKRWDPGGAVAYVQDLSRVTMAGFRIICLTLEGPLMARLVEEKRRDDLLTSTLGQYTFLNYVAGPDYVPNLQGLREFYRARRDAALEALEATMPHEVVWYRPNVGFHTWLTLPGHVSARAVTHDAATSGVIVAPSSIFSLDGALDNGLRITFADSSPALLATGIERLARVIRDHLGRTRTTSGMRVFEVI